MEAVNKIAEFLGLPNGDGSGTGYGSGAGVKSFLGQAVYMIDDVPTLIDHVHGNIAKGAILNSDLTTTPCYIVKSGGWFAHGETLREAQAVLLENNLKIWMMMSA